jgi:diguanylate cyclase (GGDEF)-like protein
MAGDWEDEATKVPPSEAAAPARDPARDPTRDPARDGDRERAYLIVLTGPNAGEMHKIATTEVVLGRGQGVNITVLDDGVSRRHAGFRLQGDDMLIEDLGSRNGTWVNGRRVQEPRRLADGDKIQVGSTTILKFSYRDHLDEAFQRRVYDAALRDGLTRAFSRKYFLDRIESEFRFAKRHRVPLSLIMMDVDDFKTVDERHGHVASDAVLVALARRVHEIIRTEDVFARHGLDEFVLLCRAVDVDAAVHVADRLRKAVAAIEHGSSERFHVTVSVGVAGLPQIATEDAAGLIAAAQAALAAAKSGGRDRVCAAPKTA